MSTNTHPDLSEESWAKAERNANLITEAITRSEKRHQDRSNLLAGLLGNLNAYAKLDAVIQYTTSDGETHRDNVSEMLAAYLDKVAEIDAAAAPTLDAAKEA